MFENEGHTNLEVNVDRAHQQVTKGHHRYAINTSYQNATEAYLNIGIVRHVHCSHMTSFTLTLSRSLMIKKDQNVRIKMNIFRR